MRTQYDVVDFGASFLRWKVHNGLSGRSTIDCVITSRHDEKSIDYLLGSGVLACKVLSERYLITEPAYMYHPMVSRDFFKIFRHGNALTTQNSHGVSTQQYASVNASIIKAQGKKLLDGEAVVSAVGDNAKICASIQLASKGINYNIQFPVKHVYHNEKKQFQIETGPIPLPSDINSMESLDTWNLCYVAFNTFEKLEYAFIRNNKISNFQYQDYGPVMDLEANIDIYSAI